MLILRLDRIPEKGSGMIGFRGVVLALDYDLRRNDEMAKLHMGQAEIGQ
jgi:hypothetical protein